MDPLYDSSSADDIKSKKKKNNKIKSNTKSVQKNTSKNRSKQGQNKVVSETTN